MKTTYQNLLEALDGLYKKGYIQSFSLTPQGLYCPLTKKLFPSNQVTISEVHHFEADSDVSDMAILYAIGASSECKGVLIDAYGTYSNSELGDFIKNCNKPK
jgi:hypothetical protein